MAGILYVQNNLVKNSDGTCTGGTLVNYTPLGADFAHAVELNADDECDLSVKWAWASPTQPISIYKRVRGEATPVSAYLVSWADFATAFCPPQIMQYRSTEYDRGWERKVSHPANAYGSCMSYYSVSWKYILWEPYPWIASVVYAYTDGTADCEWDSLDYDMRQVPQRCYIFDPQTEFDPGIYDWDGVGLGTPTVPKGTDKEWSIPAPS